MNVAFNNLKGCSVEDGRKLFSVSVVLDNHNL